MTATKSITGKATTLDGKRWISWFQRCSYARERQFAMKLPLRVDVYSPLAFNSDTSVRTS